MSRIRIPRGIHVGSMRFMHGLTLRQMGYLTLGTTIAGLTLLSAIDAMLKVPVAALLVIGALAFAFVKPEGEWLEAWLLRHAGFRRRRHGYVYKGHTAQPRLTVEPRVTTSAPTAKPVARATTTALVQTIEPWSWVGVLLGFWLVAITSALLITLLRGGRPL